MKKIIAILVTALGLLVVTSSEEGSVGFSNMRSFSTLESTTANEITYDFGVINIPTTRAATASSSVNGGYEFGKFQATTGTAFTIASTSGGFAVTMRGAGRVKACVFDLAATPTTGTVSIMIQKNETLQSGVYCKLPTSTTTFAVDGGTIFTSRTEAIGASDIPFVAGDRLGLVASSTNLSAATIEGWAKLIIQLNN